MKKQSKKQTMTETPATVAPVQIETTATPETTSGRRLPMSEMKGLIAMRSG